MVNIGMHATKIISERGELLYLVKGRNNGLLYWAYLLVDKAKEPSFLQSIGGDMVLQKFGHILCWGEGDTVPAYAKKELKQKYGYDV